MEKQLKSAAAWFEIPCVDLNRAKRFYEIILGVRLDKDDFGDSNDVMCVFPAERGAVAGALVQRSFQQPSTTGTMVYLSCDGELDSVIKRVPGAGGTILVKRTPVPGGFGTYACLKDSEGNHVGLHSAV
jgi:predicted enzyme related to lactoylglutathione lyase